VRAKAEAACTAEQVNDLQPVQTFYVTGFTRLKGRLPIRGE
jgi:hypothetical protein